MEITTTVKLFTGLINATKMIIDGFEKRPNGRKRKMSIKQRADILNSKMSVPELAKKYGVLPQIIYHIFRDRNKPNKNFMER